MLTYVHQTDAERHNLTLNMLPRELFIPKKNTAHIVVYITPVATVLLY